jgi:glycosyltransferase involved in cell wall biosynthesis
MYNAEETIIRTLDSVKMQTVGIKEFELIIINDGSTDESKILVNNYLQNNSEMNIQLLNQSNGGVSSARNTGLKISKGEFIALLDSDDVWLPNKIERQLTFFKNNHLTIDFLAVKRKNQKILFPYTVGEKGLAEITFKKLMIRNEAQPSSIMFKRKVLENTGFFDDKQRYAEDINYWLKVSRYNKMYILDEELIIAGNGKRTFGISGLSANLYEMEKGFTKNLKDMYNEKRINNVEFLLYAVFYKVKYISRLLRNKYLKFRGK